MEASPAKPAPPGRKTGPPSAPGLEASPAKPAPPGRKTGPPSAPSGFHGRAGFAEEPALLVIDVNVGFTDPSAPLACDLDDVVEAIRQLLQHARRASLPVVCVRATAVDALQHGYRAIVPRTVGDRNPTAHEANLYDIDTKYGDVVSLDDVAEHLRSLAGLDRRVRTA